MIRILLDRAFDNERHYIHAVGLSTDAKPTTGIITGSKFVAVDTGAGYLFDETAGEWNENSQLSEAVAAYLDEHPEALDQAAIEAMFSDQLDGIEEDIGGLKSAINSKLDAPETTGTSGQVLTSDGQGGQSWETPRDGGGVSDVQVNGVSVMQDGVANVPIANASRYGVVKTDSDYGTTYLNDKIAVQKSADDQCKNGTQQYRPIVPYNQHAAAFYGLAKAAGDTTQSASSNAVGNYTDDAKDKIQQMLGVSDAINDLKSALNNIDGTVNNIVSGTLYNTPTKFGNWAAPSLNWAYKSGTTRLYAEDVDVSLFKAIRYSLPQGYQLGVVTKTVDKEQIRDYGWDSDGVGYRLFSGATYATLVMRKSNNATITPDDITNDFQFAMFASKAYAYNDGPIQTIYHRGCDFAAPENTFASFKAAVNERGIYVETDVRYTSDGVAVLLHDETINRTGRNADGSEISTTINIADITYAQALEYDFGIWKGPSFAGEKIPSFDDFCKYCALYGLHPVIELKGSGAVQTAERVKTLYQTAIKYGLKGKISWLSSAYQTHLQPLTEVDADVDFWWLTNLDASHVQEALNLVTETNHIVVDTGIAYATSANQALIDTLASAGIGVTVWTANTVNDFTNLATLRGITGITTDGTDAVVALMLANGV